MNGQIKTPAIIAAVVVILLLLVLLGWRAMSNGNAPVADASTLNARMAAKKNR